MEEYWQGGKKACILEATAFDFYTLPEIQFYLKNAHR